MLLRKTLILFLSVAGNWLTWNEIRGDEAKPKAPIRIGSQLQLFIDDLRIRLMCDKVGSKLCNHRGRSSTCGHSCCARLAKPTLE
jgi:hypothetical protein